MNDNLFAALPARLSEELVTPLLQCAALRIERIVSTGQCSPDGFWYDQQQDEWVAVLQGEGVVEFADGEVATLRRGDWLNIPAGRRHRVAATSATETTVWLAIFYHG